MGFITSAVGVPSGTIIVNNSSKRRNVLAKARHIISSCRTRIRCVQIRRSSIGAQILSSGGTSPKVSVSRI